MNIDSQERITIEARIVSEADGEIVVAVGSYTTTMSRRSAIDNGDGTLTMPRWLAESRGLL